MDVQSNGHVVEPKATSAKEWIRSRTEGYPIPLPSGLIAILRPVPLDQLIEENKIPDMLTPVAAKALWSDTEATDLARDIDLHKDFISLMNLIVPMAMVSPKVVKNPDYEKEEISIKDVDFNDKVAIFNLSIQPAAVLKSFRPRQKESVESSFDSENLRDATVEDNGDSR